MINELMSFLDNSRTAFNGTRNIENRLKENGYLKLEEYESFNVEKGGRYYIVRNNSSILAFNIGEKLDEPYVFTDDHTYVYTPLEADVPKGYLFVMGDHRNNSLDSRQFGMVDERAVLGRVLVRLIPFTFF